MDPASSLEEQHMYGNEYLSMERRMQRLQQQWVGLTDDVAPHSVQEGLGLAMTGRYYEEAEYYASLRRAEEAGAAGFGYAGGVNPDNDSQLRRERGSTPKTIKEGRCKMTQ